MGFYDKIKYFIYSDTIERYNDLYQNHFEALNAFIEGFQPIDVVSNSYDKTQFFLCRDQCKKRCVRIKKELYAGKQNLSISSMRFLVKNKSTIIELYENRIKNWIAGQNNFGKKYRILCDEILNSWGCYQYNIENKFFHSGCKTFSIWQFFPHSFCLAEDIEYNNYTYYKNNGQRLLNETLYSNYEEEWIEKDLINFLNKIDEPYSIVFCKLDKSFHTGCYEVENDLGILNDLMCRFYRYEDGLKNDSYCICDNLRENIDKLNKNIIVIDAITNNNRLKSIVNDIIECAKHKCPNIIYISIYKELDKNEMLSLIDIRDKALSIITDSKYKRGYDYYISVNEFKPFSLCRSRDYRRIVSSKKMFEDKVKELECIDDIKAKLSKTILLARASCIEQAQEIIIEAEQKRIEAELPEKEDKELKALIEETNNKLNIEYKGIGFSEEWKELRVDYSVPEEFLQIENLKYVVSKFPEKGTIIYPYRRRKAARIGHIENSFLEQLLELLPAQIQPIHDICINVSDNTRPYEPDIALFIEGYNTIRIDVEIDEPYVPFSKEPIHYIGCGDEYRDDLLNRHGWIVVRFAEKQIKKYPKSCVSYLAKLIKSLVPEIAISTELLSAIPLPPLKRWTKNEAMVMAANGEREKYLGHVFSKTEEKSIELSDIKLNENERKCKSLVKVSAMSKGMTEDFVRHPDLGAYKISKDVDSLTKNKISKSLSGVSVYLHLQTDISNRQENQIYGVNFNLDGSDITFEQDGKLSFSEAVHIYSLDGVEFSSVSNIVSKFFREFDAIEISLKKCYGNELEATKLREMWESKGRVASQVGTFLHKKIKDYLNGRQTPDLLCDVSYKGKYVKVDKTVDISREWSYFKAFERNTPFVPFRTEWCIYDADSHMAGTLDFVCVCPDGTYEIYDWKRSNKIDPTERNPWANGLNGLEHLTDTSYSHYCLQQNLYRYMLQKNYGLKVSRMNLVVLHPELPTYRVVPIPPMEREVSIILDKLNEII